MGRWPADAWWDPSPSSWWLQTLGPGLLLLLLKATVKSKNPGLPGGRSKESTLPVQETQVQILVWEDCTCLGAAKPQKQV